MNRPTLLLLAALVLAGCQQAPRPKLTEEDLKPNGSGSAQTDSPSGQIEPDPGAGEPNTPQEPGSAARKPEEAPAPKTPPGMPPADRPIVRPPVVVKPESDGWKPVSFSQSEFTSRLDKAMTDLRDVAGSYEIELRNLELEGTQQGTFVIHDSTLYAIEGLTIDKPTAPRRFQADGEKKSALGPTGWGKEIPVTALQAPPNVTANQLVNEFPLLVFSGVFNRRPLWDKLVTNLENEGYTLHLETKDIAMQGRPRPFYRLVAKKEGSGLNTFEMRIDGIRWVPLTIRVLATGSGGKPITAEWRAQWSFNQKVEKVLREGRGFNPQQPQ